MMRLHGRREKGANIPVVQPMSLLKAATRQIRSTHWLSALGGTAGAYLFFFYAGVFLELQRPSPMIVFIG
jgi:hypothetical protein